MNISMRIREALHVLSAERHRKEWWTYWEMSVDYKRLHKNIAIYKSLSFHMMDHSMAYYYQILVAIDLSHNMCIKFYDSVCNIELCNEWWAGYPSLEWWQTQIGSRDWVRIQLTASPIIKRLCIQTLKSYEHGQGWKGPSVCLVCAHVRCLYCQWPSIAWRRFSRTLINSWTDRPYLLARKPCIGWINCWVVEERHSPHLHSPCWLRF